LKFSAMAEHVAGSQIVEGAMTAEELLQVDIPGKWTELVRGVLQVSEPPGITHGIVAARLTHRMAHHVYEHRLGEVAAQDTGFHIASDPDTVRAPDVAFISNERLSAVRPRGYADGAPDLAVEILSPGDRPAEVLEKIADWLRAGVRLVWVVDMERRVGRVHRADGSIALVPRDGAFDGEDVLPAFSCDIADLLATL
jgi:Uma2 family endonuclease